MKAKIQSFDAAEEYWQADSFYRWEFLRKNEEFLKENELLFVLHGRMLSEKTKNKNIATRQYLKAKKIFIGKWGLNKQYRPMHAFWNYYACLASETNSSPFSPAIDPFVHAGECYQPIFKNLKNFGAKKINFRVARIRSSSGKDFDPKKIKKMSITIDFDKPKLQILHEISKVVDIVQKSKGGKETKRSRLDNYKDYLRVYIDRKYGDTFQVIAERLWPNNKSNLKRVKDYYKAAEKLIGDSKRRQIGPTTYLD